MSDVNERQKYVEELKKIVTGYESKVDELGREVDRLTKHSNKLRSELMGSPIKLTAASPTKLESIN
jgi:predicted RNase H-like nuclease (RuvC/YqgF family)